MFLVALESNIIQTDSRNSALASPLDKTPLAIKTEIARVLIHGRCHCGTISFYLTWQPDPDYIPANACGCSFCIKHGGVWTANLRAALKVTIKDFTRISRYAFGTRTAEFHVCMQCGIVPLVTSRIDERIYAVVNINTFEDFDASILRGAATNFDGEGTYSRLARRQRNWIADVEFSAN